MFDNTENDYTIAELEEAVYALTSLISKCEKAKQKLVIGTSQYTLLTRRLEAFNIAITIINGCLTKKLNEGNNII